MAPASRDRIIATSADDLTGLAVGRSGAAWATDDGGRTWRDASLGADVMLSSVAFLADGDAIVAGEGGPWRLAMP